MDPLSNLLALMVLSGSVSLFIPDGEGQSSFTEGEIFPSPIGSFYDRGWTVGYYTSRHSEFEDGDMLMMNIAKGFSLQRFYLSPSQLMEFGGYAGAYNQFLRQSEPEEPQLLNNDYLLKMNFSYLNGGFMTKLIWGYEHHQAHTDHLDSMNSEEPTSEPPAIDDDGQLTADSLELLIGDIRQSFRYYLAYGKLQHFAPSSRKGFSRFGFDYRSGALNSMHLILAAEQRSYAYNNWAVTNTVRLGLERSRTPFEGWRILWEWTEGKSDYGPYRTADASLSGISFQRIF